MEMDNQERVFVAAEDFDESDISDIEVGNIMNVVFEDRCQLLTPKFQLFNQDGMDDEDVTPAEAKTKAGPSTSKVRPKRGKAKVEIEYEMEMEEAPKRKQVNL